MLLVEGGSDFFRCSEVGLRYLRALTVHVLDQSDPPRLAFPEDGLRLGGNASIGDAAFVLEVPASASFMEEITPDVLRGVHPYYESGKVITGPMESRAAGK